MDLSALLSHAHTLAVVGCSPQPWRTSHGITRYLLDVGYTVVPVNPHHDEVLGLRCYPSVDAIPADLPLDIVVVFRNAAHTADAVQEVVAWQALAGRSPVVWTQLGVSSPEAEALAATHGLPYVEERCIMVEHGRRVG